MDPSLQTPVHRRNEQSVAKAVEVRWGCRLPKIADTSEVDRWIEFAGERRGSMEIKCRERRSWDFSGLIYCNLNKYLAIDRRGGQGYFCVAFIDGIFVVNIRELDPDTAVRKGRKDRGIAADVQPAIPFAVSSMLPLRCAEFGD